MSNYGTLNSSREAREDAPLLPRSSSDAGAIQDKATDWIHHNLDTRSMVVSNLILTLATR